MLMSTRANHARESAPLVPGRKTRTSYGHYGTPALWMAVAGSGLLAIASAKTSKALTLRVFINEAGVPRLKLRGYVVWVRLPKASAHLSERKG